MPPYNQTGRYNDAAACLVIRVDQGFHPSVLNAGTSLADYLVNIISGFIGPRCPTLATPSHGSARATGAQQTPDDQAGRLGNGDVRGPESLAGNFVVLARR